MWEILPHWHCMLEILPRWQWQFYDAGVSLPWVLSHMGDSPSLALLVWDSPPLALFMGDSPSLALLVGGSPPLALLVGDSPPLSMTVLLYRRFLCKSKLWCKKFHSIIKYILSGNVIPLAEKLPKTLYFYKGDSEYFIDFMGVSLQCCRGMKVLLWYQFLCRVKTVETKLLKLMAHLNLL